MSDVVVTVPKSMWLDWIEEGDLPGDEWTGMASHFWIPRQGLPDIVRGERVYIVAHGKLRGWAPLNRIEASCRIWQTRACLMRTTGAVALTIPEPIRGFQGWRRRWWDRSDEQPFPCWRAP